MTKHNKKRNVGLVYEMLLSFITENVMNNNTLQAKKAVKIIERRYKKNTELYKEFRLFNALCNSTVSGTHIAAGILAEAKHASRRFDLEKLKKEKSLLIKDINYQLNESNFFNRKIKNYKKLATIQLLINEWCAKDKSNLNKMIEYERVVVDQLLETPDDSNKLNFDDRSDKLVFNLLSEKLNDKYNKTLNREQKEIIRNYAVYENDSLGLETYLENLKIKTTKALNKFESETDNFTLLNKIDEVHQKVKNLSVKDVDDSTIMKYMTISKLKEQLLRSDNE